MTQINAELERAVVALSQLPEAARTLLGPITTDEQLDFALDAQERLGRMIAGDANHPLGSVYAALLVHITQYEQEAYPTTPTAPEVMLDFLMDQQGIRQTELAERLGIHQSGVSRLVSGQVAFTTDLIKRLGEIFQVPPAVFIG